MARRRERDAERTALASEPVAGAHEDGGDGDELAVVGVVPGDEDPHTSAATEPSTRWMVARILQLAFPAVAANVLGFFAQLATQAFVGHRLGEDALAHYAVGVSIYNLFGLSIGMGLASALDTLASQAYGRSSTNPEIGELLQRSIAVSLALALPVGVVFLSCEPLLAHIFGSDLAAGAALMLRHSIPYLLLTLCNSSVIKVLQAQNLPALQLVATAGAAVACLVINHAFLRDSIADAVFCLTLTQLVLLLQLVALCVFHPAVALRHARWPFAPRLFSLFEMRSYLAVGGPSLLSVAAEWWVFEALIVLAAQVSQQQLTLLSVMMSCTSFLFSVPLGISVAASTAIGNSLGANAPREAKRYVLISLVVDQAFNVITVSSLIIGRALIARIFTDDLVLIGEFTARAALAALFHWGDSTQFTLQGIFRGAGQQAQSARALLSTLWCVGFPLAALFGLRTALGASGILLGLFCGFCIEVPLMVWMLRRWDWAAIARSASCSLRQRGSDASIADAADAADVDALDVSGNDVHAGVAVASAVPQQTLAEGAPKALAD